MYSPSVRGDLLYAIIVIAVFAGVLLGVWGVDGLLSRADRLPPPGPPALPAPRRLALLGGQPEAEADHDQAGQSLEPTPDAGTLDHHAEPVAEQDDREQPDNALGEEDRAQEE